MTIRFSISSVKPFALPAVLGASLFIGGASGAAFAQGNARTTLPNNDPVNAVTAQPAQTAPDTAGMPPLMSGVPKRAGKVVYMSGTTTIQNRIDPNATKQLSAHEMTEQAAAETVRLYGESPAAIAAGESAKADVAKAEAPAADDLQAKLKDAEARYKAAKLEVKAAAKAKDKTRVAAAKKDVAAIQVEIKDLKKQIAAERKAAKATAKMTEKNTKNEVKAVRKTSKTAGHTARKAVKKAADKE